MNTELSSFEKRQLEPSEHWKKVIAKIPDEEPEPSTFKFSLVRG